MTHPVLPKLKDGHTVKAFARAGVWDVRQRDALTHLTQSLEVAGTVDTDLSSIPDMWARPMLFEMALLNPAHVLHMSVRGEWRGLLAMMALKEALALDRFGAMPVTVPNHTAGNGAAVPAQRDFLHTLAKLLPVASLSQDTSWQSLYVLIFNGKAVGMTSPTTLVATAADYLNRISSQDVPWYDGARLQDPVRVLSPGQRQLVAGWLDHLINRMRRHPGLDPDRWNMMSGLLRSYRDDLGAPESINFILGRSSLGIQGQTAGIFQYLDKPAAAVLDSSSHVELIASPGRAPAKRLLVFDRSIADQWNTDPQNITLTGAQTLASAKYQVNDAEVWKGADFFTRKLVLVYQEDAFPGALSSGGESLKRPGGTTPGTAILPLNPKLLEYLTAEELARSVRWEQTPEGLKIHLLLKLTGTDATDKRGRSVELTRLYRAEDVHTLNNVPILEIWPNFTAPGWKAYYTCYSTGEVTTTFEAKPWTPGEIIEKEVPLVSPRLRRYWRTDSFPEAMLCRTAIPDEKNRRTETQDVGILLMRPPQVIRPQGATYRVGVDFGASSTTICAGTGRAGASPVVLENRKSAITASGRSGQAQLFDFFLPDRPSEMPVLSFFHDFSAHEVGQDIRPLLDGHAYLLETSDFSPEAQGLAFDLKWSHVEDDRKRIRAFLKQLCLQTAAELIVKHGATSAQWSFSYPTALDDGRRHGFPTICEQATDECFELSGLNRAAPNGERTESEAAALYFVDYCHAATSLGAIFIDIGGSTSDIAVWQNDKPVWQTSLLLAGRSLFSNYLWHRPAFLKDFGIPDAARLPAIKQASGNERRFVHACTNAILRYHSEKIFQQLPLRAGSSEVKELQRHLALGIGGLFFYLGMLLRYLTETGHYHQEVPNIYLGGNGARVLRWLDVDGDGRIHMLCKALFSHGAGWSDDKPFEIKVSRDLKLEAALGLVSQMPVQSGSGKDGVLAGESCIIEGAPADWNTVLTSRDFTQRVVPPAKLERLAEYLRVFEKHAAGAGFIAGEKREETHLAETRLRLSQVLSERRRQNADDVLVEPIFSIALRLLLEVRLGG